MRVPPIRTRVLFVDDEPSIVALGVRMLERYGYSPRGYTTSGEAVAALRAQPGATDVLVTDLDMPGMNGFDVAQSARAIRADLPIVLVSGLLTEEQRRRAEAIGVSATLPKPYDGNELHATLQKVLAAGSQQGTSEAPIESIRPDRTS
jgi:CheY-like chemotaxis protein